MTRADKTLEAMRANPRDWRIASLESVVFEHSALAEALTVPARRPIKPVYVRRFVQWIDTLRGDDEQA